MPKLPPMTLKILPSSPYPQKKDLEKWLWKSFQALTDFSGLPPSSADWRQLWHTLGKPYRESRSNFLGFRVSYSDTKKLLVIHFQLQIRAILNRTMNYAEFSCIIKSSTLISVFISIYLNIAFWNHIGIVSHGLGVNHREAIRDTRLFFIVSTYKSVCLFTYLVISREKITQPLYQEEWWALSKKWYNKLNLIKLSIFSSKKHYMTENIIMENGMIFVNYSALITSYWKQLFVIWGKLRRAHPTKSGHCALAYLGGSNKLRTSLEVSLWWQLYINF